MAASTFVNLVRVYSNSAGTGPLVLGLAEPGFRGVEALTDGATYSYTFQIGVDNRTSGAAAYETGRGVWNASTSTLTRNVIESSLAGQPVGLLMNTPIAITVLAQDFAATDQAALAAAVLEAQGSADDAAASAASVVGDVALADAAATAAGVSATNAANSATLAGTKADAASASATTAGNAATSANNAATNANGSAIAAAASATDAAGSVAAVGASATAAANSATAAAGSATSAGLSASSADSYSIAAGASATAAHNDRLAADADAATTTADRAAVHTDRLQADADALATAADRTATHTDRLAADADAVATAADRVQTGLDRTSTTASATAAGTSATTASTAATTATTQAGIATTQAGIATTQAGNAGTSATAAAGSATAASGSATAAAGSVTAAGTSATNAASSATTAGTNATAAATSATAASGSATSASASATTATNSATTANSAASTAASAATTATNQASIATTAASNPSFKIQTNPATPTVPPSGVSSGDTYWVVDANPATKLTLYLNTSGTGAPTSTVVVDTLAGGGSSGGSRYIGRGVPANNQFSNGDIYVDSDTGLSYGPKTNGLWPLGTMADANAATPARYRSDFRIPGMAFPTAHWTLTRAGARTDMLFTDDYTYAPTSFGSGIPMIRPGKGLGIFSPATQLLANPGAPVTETLTLNSGGTYVVTCWGPAGSALGVATGTATATITKFSTGSAASSLGGTEKTFLTIVVTGTGTVIFTPSGGLTKANVILNGSSPSSTQPVPYIATQSTIPADLYAGTSAFNALIGSAQGYFIVGITDTNLRTYINPSPLGLNGSSAMYLSNDTQYIMYDGTHSSSGLSIGNAKFSTGAALGRTWDATATVDNGAGDSRPYSFAFQHNNGAAVTASALGVAATTGSFANFTHINGFISFYEIDPSARISTSALYTKYSSWLPPATISVLHNFLATSLPKWKRGLAQMNAGVRDAVLCIVGSSHSAGQYPTNDAKRNSWGWQASTKLTAAGIQAWPYAYCGDDQYTIPAGGGTSLYDPYVSFSAGWSKSASRSNQFGGNIILTTTTGATFTHAIPVATNSYSITAYQGPGYGIFTIAANGGSVLATVNCDNPTPAELVTTVTVPPGVNSFAITVTSTGSKPVKIARSLPNDTRFKKVLIFNGARSAANSADLSNNTAVENSYLLGLANLAPDLTIVQGPVTNAASASESAATFTTNMTTVYNTAAVSGSVLMMDDPASSVGVVTLANQTLYRNLDATIAYGNSSPFLSAYEISTYELGNARGLYGDTVHGSAIDNGIIADNVTYTLQAASV